MVQTSDDKKKEWLKFLELITRIYGKNYSDTIRDMHYTNRDGKDVAEYFKDKLPNSGITNNTTLVQLFKNTEILKLFTSTSADIQQFTEIYNDTDYLMKSLNTKEDNVYIKCNPVDDNGTIIEISNNTLTSNTNAMLNDLGNIFKPEMMYNNIGLQTFMAIVFLGLVYGIGNYMFIVYPNNTISKRLANL